MGFIFSRTNLNHNDISSNTESPSHHQVLKKNHQFSYGNAVFSINPTDYNQIQKIDEEYFNMLFDSDWNIEYLQFIKNNWHQVFQKMIQAQIQILAMYKCGSTNVIRQIEHINLSNLINLSLGANKIKNIQSLAHINLSNLQILRLNQNQIISIQPLSKLHCFKLETLSLYYNPLKGLQNMNRVKFSNKNSQNHKNKLSFQSNMSFSNEPHQISIRHNQLSITFLTKLQLKHISSIQSSYRALQQKQFSVIKSQIYPSLVVQNISNYYY